MILNWHVKQTKTVRNYGNRIRNYHTLPKQSVSCFYADPELMAKTTTKDQTAIKITSPDLRARGLSYSYYRDFGSSAWFRSFTGVSRYQMLHLGRGPSCIEGIYTDPQQALRVYHDTPRNQDTCIHSLLSVWLVATGMNRVWCIPRLCVW